MVRFGKNPSTRSPHGFFPASWWTRRWSLTWLPIPKLTAALICVVFLSGAFDPTVWGQESGLTQNAASTPPKSRPPPSSNTLRKQLKKNLKHQTKAEKRFQRANKKMAKSRKKLDANTSQIQSTEGSIYHLKIRYNLALQSEKNKSSGFLEKENVSESPVALVEEIQAEKELLKDLQLEQSKMKQDIEEHLYKVYQLKDQMRALKAVAQRLNTDIPKAEYRESLVGPSK